MRREIPRFAGCMRDVGAGAACRPGAGSRGLRLPGRRSGRFRPQLFGGRTLHGVPGTLGGGSGRRTRFLTGDLHTSEVTLYGLLLASEDSGKTWSEPIHASSPHRSSRFSFTIFRMAGSAARFSIHYRETRSFSAPTMAARPGGIFLSSKTLVRQHFAILVRYQDSRRAAPR